MNRSLYHQKQGEIPDDIPRMVDRRYKRANLPRDSWHASRDTTITTEKNRSLCEAVVIFIDNQNWYIDQGKGITVVGPAKSGKSYFLSAILKSYISQDASIVITEEFSDCLRVDYQELLTLSRAVYSEELNYNLRESKILFVDNIYGTNPTPDILSCLEYRRDQHKTTLLAFLSHSISGIQGLERVCGIFQDINELFLIEEQILPYLKKKK